MQSCLLQARCALEYSADLAQWETTLVLVMQVEAQYETAL